MASYVASNATRDVVTIMLSKAEADALRRVADYGMADIAGDMNIKQRLAAERAISALAASTSSHSRRAGFFE